MFFHIPFSLHDEKQLADWLENAGFKNNMISQVEIDCSSASAADTATGMLEGSPIYTAITERNPAVLPLIKKDVVAMLAKRFGAAPMVSPMQALVVEAEKH
jgi:hypothetical protein